MADWWFTMEEDWGKQQMGVLLTNQNILQWSCSIVHGVCLHYKVFWDLQIE